MTTYRRFGSGIVLVAGLLGLFAAPDQAAGQGEHLDRGESGFGVRGGVSFSEDSSGFGLTLDYLVAGILDLGISVGRGGLDEEEVGTEISFTSISPSMGVYVLKQAPEIPISCYVEAGYLKATYSGDALDELNWDMTASGWGLAGSIFGRMPLSPEAVLIPRVGVSHASIEGKIEDRFGDSISNEEATTSFDLGLSFGFDLSSDSVFFISPGLSFGDETTTFSVNIGFAVDTTPRKSNWGSRTKPERRSQWRPPSRSTSPQEPAQSDTQEPIHPPLSAQPNGDRISEETVLKMQEMALELTTIETVNFTAEQINRVAQVFKVPPGSVKTFRWGRSMAAKGHPHAGSIWFRIEYGDEPYRATEILRVSPTGIVLERMKK